MSEENQSQSSQLGLNFVIFILAILIVANTEKEEWFALDYQTYYYFIVFSLTDLGLSAIHITPMY